MLEVIPVTLGKIQFLGTKGKIWILCGPERLDGVSKDATFQRVQGLIPTGGPSQQLNLGCGEALSWSSEPSGASGRLTEGGSACCCQQQGSANSVSAGGLETNQPGFSAPFPFMQLKESLAGTQ